MADTKTNPKILIYSTPQCHFCKATKAFLTKHNIPFTDIDVSEDKALQREMIEKSNQMGVPVIDIDGKIVVGFDEERLKMILGID